MTRLDRALAIRDMVVPRIAKNGTPQTLSGIHFLEANIAGIKLLYRTPFGNHRISLLPHNYNEALLLQRSGPLDLGYALEGWNDRRKVISLQWSAAGTTHLCSFRGGAWESALARALA